MSGRPDSYMPIYIADYLGDTRLLSLAEHGAYLLLMFQYWRVGCTVTRPCGIPDCDTILARICSATVADWETVSVAVRAFFKPAIINGKKVLIHKRIEQELDKARSNYEKRVAASTRANQAKADAANRLKAKAVAATDTVTVTEPDTVSDTVTETVSVTQLRTQNSTKEESKKENPKEKTAAPAAPVAIAPLPDIAIPEFLDRRKTKPNALNGHASYFQAFYDVYPLHEAKRAAEKAYISALKRASPETILAGAIRYRDSPKRQSKPEFTKMPATWLNADCWLDEATTGPTDEYSSLKARFEKQYTESSDGNENRET